MDTERTPVRGHRATEINAILSPWQVEEAATFQLVPICILRKERVSSPQVPARDGDLCSLTPFASELRFSSLESHLVLAPLRGPA